jgi:hypothetical protein
MVTLHDNVNFPKRVISMIAAGTVDRLSLGHEAVSECARRA